MVAAAIVASCYRSSHAQSATWHALPRSSSAPGPDKSSSLRRAPLAESAEGEQVTGGAERDLPTTAVEDRVPHAFDEHVTVFRDSDGEAHGSVGIINECDIENVDRGSSELLTRVAVTLRVHQDFSAKVLERVSVLDRSGSRPVEGASRMTRRETPERSRACGVDLDRFERR